MQATMGLDTAALGRLFDRYGERVYGYCVRLLGCEHDAADAVQDAFVNLARRRSSAGDDPDAQRAYVFAAARNACFDLRRRRREAASLEVLLEAGADPAAPDAPPEQRLLAAETRDDVRRALAAIPARQRSAWVMRELGELSYEEIGERLGMNENAVAQLLHRARRSLAAAFPEATRP
jgi:RNA polymerase sigma-70 factor, ECF subfamily